MEVSRPLAIDRIGAQGTEILVEARTDELPAVAARLRIPAVTRLACRFRLRRVDTAVVAVDGELDAVVTQTCVVALEPFEQAVRESFSLEFVPEGSETDDPDPDAVDQIPYNGRSIDLGEAAVEQLALVLDPYPHGPDADQAGFEEEASSPFAALSAMRLKQ